MNEIVEVFWTQKSSVLWIETGIQSVIFNLAGCFPSHSWKTLVGEQTGLAEYAFVN